MELILWRHAQAAPAGDAGDEADLARPLTARGREQARSMAAWLDAALPRDARVLTSPALRTLQTAQALSRRKPRIVDLISPALGTPEHLLATAGWRLAGHEGGREDATVLVVGHQPVLGMTAALLMCGRPLPWSVKKGAVWWLRSRGTDDRGGDGNGCELLAVRAPGA